MKESVLEYIGLDMNKMPKEILKFTPINFHNYNASNSYKVYKYISVDDLEILITPLDRTAELKERYNSAKPLSEYLTTDDKKMKNIFLEVLKSASINEIKKLEDFQEKAAKEIPYFVRYDKNYLWQIYYSKEDDKYFMLFPANEGETSVLFYIIKKKLEKKDTKIFVPINKMDYQEKILSKIEINDIENYIWLFTNDWPNIYEVLDDKIYITGKVKLDGIFDSFYRNIYDNRKEAENFYMLLKAMFILTTETNYKYKFMPYINSKGELELKYENKVININNITEFVDIETNIKKNKIIQINKEIKNNEKILKELQEYIKEQNNIYVMQEKRIAMFLECKKSFFKKLTYFFKVKKFTIPKISTKIDENIKISDEKIEEKGSYNIRDLINVTIELNNIDNKNKNIKADIKALKLKKENLERKIKNANTYIEEIEKHKKSIFEFWKFTNKDEVLKLNEPEKQEISKNKVLGVFDVEQDLEMLGKRVDSIQRKELSNNECDNIYIMKYCLDAVNNISDEKILKEVLNELKEKLEYNGDAFKGILKEYEESKNLKNKWHRENKRNELMILNINKSTTSEDLKKALEKTIKTLEKAYKKIRSITDMYIYIKKENVKKDSKYLIGDINPKNIYDDSKNSKETKKNEDDKSDKDNKENKRNKENKNFENISLYKIKVKENDNILYFSNIIFYENKNETLPLGMDLGSEVLLKMPRDIEENLKKEEIYILDKIDDFNYEVNKIEIFEQN